VGMALHSIDVSLLPEWDNWSRQSSKYQPGECDRKWHSFKGNGVGIGSLAEWAKQDGWQHRGNRGESRPNRNNLVRLPVEHQSLEALRGACRDILSQNLPASELQLAQIQLRTDNPGISEREIKRLLESVGQELELEQLRPERRQEVEDLLTLGDRSLNLEDFLPVGLAQPLTQMAARLNIRPEVCLTALLAAVSSLHKTQTELVIEEGQEFSVPPTIFAALISESGQKKSPVLKAIVRKPLALLQGEQRQTYEQSVEEYEQGMAEWDRCKADERREKFPQGKPKKPRQRLYYFTDASGEGLSYQFQAHPDKALLALVDELAGLFNSENKYRGGRGSDKQDMLSAFDGTGATILRVDGARVDIEELRLSIFGTIQPAILQGFMKGGSDPDGQWARLLFVYQPLVPATLEPGAKLDITERLVSYYRAIDQIPDRRYRLSPEAFQRYQPVYNQLEILRVTTPEPGMRAVYSKMEGYIGRLALNLHVLHEVAAGHSLPDPQIPVECMEQAIALAKFYIGQVRLVHAESGERTNLVPYLAKAIALSQRLAAATGNGWIKAKDIQLGYDARHRPKPEEARSWMRELEAMGLGATRGAGIRLEYNAQPKVDNSISPLSGCNDAIARSQAVDNRSTFSPLPEPHSTLAQTSCQPPIKVEPVEESGESGEKWIASLPPETASPSAVSTQVEKVDNLPSASEEAGWFEEGNIQDLTSWLADCPDLETLALLRQCEIPPAAFNRAAQRLNPEQHARIKAWVELQNAARPPGAENHK